ncbi:MAG: PBP1A family penicillin-binding protein [Bacteriovoracaceae bacterium]|jgi:penicillin-binding protein 1A|nr:PBP1A family penicillin-binding protein [Bacteriovoracaceae bacterium]
MFTNTFHKKLIIGLLGLGIIGAFSIFCVIAYFSYDLPKISTLNDYNPPIPSQILAKDGTILASIGKEKRDIVQFKDIPKLIIGAFLSAEDDNFYNHKGVDYLGILRAAFKNLRAGRVVQGGSTITQQVAKSLLVNKERSIVRKIKDLLLARRIEKKFSKQDILFLYLNQVYLGGGYYGLKSAFRGYFNKDLDEATIAESAMIAGLLVAPGKYSPYRHPEYAKKRQAYVLKRMYETKKIDRVAYEEALAEKIKYRLRRLTNFKAGYFTDWVRQRVIEEVGKDNFLTNGFRVSTTLDWELQKIAEKNVWEGVLKIDKRQGYSGPIDHIEDEEEISLMEIEFRKDLYKNESQYFTINENKLKEYELQFVRDDFDKIKSDKTEWNKNSKVRAYPMGNSSDDPLLKHLNKEIFYRARVISLSNSGRFIYVSIGGAKGIIPFENYRWAHERLILEEKTFHPSIINPNDILKKNDIILVSIEEFGIPINKLATAGFISRVKKHKKKKAKKKILEQKFLHCKLQQMPIAQGALVSIDPFTGHVHSLVGGADFNKSQFNRALQSKRQPGSSFKPILFAVGLENNFNPATIIIDSPEALGGADESLNWKPRNYDGKFKGPITFRNSLEQSRNVPTIKIADKLGVPTILDFTKRIGFNAKLDPDLSLSLGSFGVTLMDIVTTYAIFPSGGKRIHPISILKIIDRFGKEYNIRDKSLEVNEKDVNNDEKLVKSKVTLEPIIGNPAIAKTANEGIIEEEKNPFLLDLDEVQVYDKRLAYLMTNLLKGVVHHGTGRRARAISQYLGGKTGTTNSYVDAWFIGFSANLVTGVWTGLDDNKTLGWGETGAKSALPIWNEFMRAGIKKFGEYDFKMPKGIINVLINKKTGELTSGNRKDSFMDSFVKGYEPGVMKNREDDYNSQLDDKSTDFLEEDGYFDNQ